MTPRVATRLRVFLLTLAVFDDLGALLVIATAYTKHVRLVALAVAFGLVLVLVALRYAPPWRRQVSVAIGVALWVAMFKSGIDPVIVGLAVGLVTSAYPPSRENLERATALTRSFREQPTPELARSAQQGVLLAISPNERLQYSLHPWTSFVIVPTFALANAGIHITGGLLRHAVKSPITIGILVAYVVGKPLGILGASWVASRPRLHGQRPPVSWPLLGSAGAVAGIGFAADLEPGVLGRAPERGKARRARRRGRRAVAGIRRPAHNPPLAGQRPRPADSRHRRRSSRPVRRRRSGARPHSRARGRPGHAARIRGLRVPLLRAGGAGDPRAAVLLRR
jgi:Na+/H+ antiporter NhaA